MFRGVFLTYSQREKEGPAPQAWEDEGLHRLPERRRAVELTTPSPSHRFAAGPSLSPWERVR
jgi:hypothetical protein